MTPYQIHEAEQFLLQIQQWARGLRMMERFGGEGIEGVAILNFGDVGRFRMVLAPIGADDEREG